MYCEKETVELLEMSQFQFPNLGGVLMSKYPMRRWLNESHLIKLKAASPKPEKRSRDFLSVATRPNNLFPAPYKTYVST